MSRGSSLLSVSERVRKKEIEWGNLIMGLLPKDKAEKI